MRYMIYVKKGIYEEKVEVTKKKINLIIVGDGMYSTIITGSLNVVDGSTTFRSATLAAIGKGFILTKSVYKAELTVSETPDSITETVGCVHLTDMPQSNMTGVQSLP
ncbi:hypothetical protein FXO38_33014 [Capsicum annuum]|nr:hypothetical protein FXO38_33014 [Capsicum annuum]